jgi:hypothetical protein
LESSNLKSQSKQKYITTKNQEKLKYAPRENKTFVFSLVIP